MLLLVIMEPVKKELQGGTISQNLFAQGVSDEKNLQDNLNNIGEIGTAKGLNTNYPLGWAQATNAPFKNWKQDAQSEGGTRNPLIVYYPKGIKEKGGIRNQYSHVTDIFLLLGYCRN